MDQDNGLQDYYIIKNNKKLRYGYTTGSCAAAAAKAAVTMLLMKKDVGTVDLMTPKGILLHLNLEEIKRSESQVSCAVRKDGGDDPDATTGTLVYAKVWKTLEAGVTIDGGKGVGRVTKKGLEQPVGAAAINRVPRQMIREAVTDICEEQDYHGGIAVEISIPEGVEIAKKTFNPRLGIEGGISVLGTSGIVVPMSEAALIASIRLEMEMKKANGAEYLAITPGNYGEAFSKDHLNIDLTNSMKCSNYVGDTIDMAVELGMKGILFIAHIGKFIKVAGGIMNTHSRCADSRAEIMAANAVRAGAPIEAVQKILQTITTEEALGILKDYGCMEAVMEHVLEKIDYYLDHRSYGSLKTGVILFSNEYGTLGVTSSVEELMSHFVRSHKRILETDRLYLREMVQEDFPDLCKMLKDEEVMRAYEHAFADREAHEWLDRQIMRYQQYGFGLWAVIIKDSDEMIGQCGITMQDIEGVEVPEVGYLFQKAYWHQGYASEAAAACKKYAFEVLEVPELYSIIRDTNIPSQKVAVRNGMTHKGQFVKHYYGIDMPHYIYSITRDQINNS